MSRLRKALHILAVAGLAVSCASKPLEYKDADKIAVNPEYEKAIQVKEIKDEPQASASPQPSPSPTPVPKSAIKKKGKKEAAAAPAAPEKRQPTIEDDEGFVGRRPAVDPLRVGEKMTFMMTYFGVSAGDMTLSMKPMVEVNGRKSYHAHVRLKSSDIFSMFYSVDDSADTFIDYETLLPHSFEVNAVESKKLLAVKSVFNWDTMKAWRWEKRVSKEEGEKAKRNDWDLIPYSQNVLSAFWYLRMFKLTPGKTLQFRVADDGKNMVVKVEVVRREKLKTDLGTFDTVVVKPIVEIGGIFQPMGDVYFWMTDDDRKLYVKIEAKIKIGKIIGYLKTLEKGTH
ncbi:MAG TPA: DUF3108 domain-containing protein [Bdellovibrionales bacterium]|nr:DUF3108 domain-containing protein [Bdellovibrionales bacterium]